MAVDRRLLIAKAREHKADERDRIKKIEFLLPEPNSATWNGFSLLAKAEWLLVGAGVSDAIRSEFTAESRGNFKSVLECIDSWFSVVVTTNQTQPLGESIGSYYDRVLEMDFEFVELDESESADALLGKLELDDEEEQRQEEIKRAAIAKIRDELGLNDDEQIIVRIIRNKK
jgi:hypothetical protein